MIKPVTIIGSSNIYRFVDDLDSDLKRAIDMQNCTRMEVIIAVIENFLMDVVEDAFDPFVIEQRVNNCLDKFFRVINVEAKRLRTTKFALVEPMARPSVKW